MFIVFRPNFITRPSNQSKYFRLTGEYFLNIAEELGESTPELWTALDDACTALANEETAVQQPASTFIGALFYADSKCRSVEDLVPASLPIHVPSYCSVGRVQVPSDCRHVRR